jgi:hypothetical protein
MEPKSEITNPKWGTWDQDGNDDNTLSQQHEYIAVGRDGIDRAG